jgi:hypothetical protein
MHFFKTIFSVRLHNNKISLSGSISLIIGETMFQKSRVLLLIILIGTLSTATAKTNRADQLDAYLQEASAIAIKVIGGLIGFCGTISACNWINACSLITTGYITGAADRWTEIDLNVHHFHHIPLLLSADEYNFRLKPIVKHTVSLGSYLIGAVLFYRLAQRLERRFNQSQSVLALCNGIKFAAIAIAGAELHAVLLASTKKRSLRIP